MVRNPKVFLFDEPLSNLDASLREEMRSELIQLHARLGKTTIYVTHDQIEAMTMAQKIVLMQNNCSTTSAKPGIYRGSSQRYRGLPTPGHKTAKR
jgi:ABC-type sugar transport system ATPase subunit